MEPSHLSGGGGCPHGASRTRTGDLLGAIEPLSHTESDAFAAVYGRASGAPQHLPQHLHRVVQRHEILDTSAGAIEEERASTLHGKEGVDGSSPSELCKSVAQRRFSVQVDLRRVDMRGYGAAYGAFRSRSSPMAYRGGGTGASATLVDRVAGSLIGVPFGAVAFHTAAPAPNAQQCVDPWERARRAAARVPRISLSALQRRFVQSRLRGARTSRGRGGTRRCRTPTRPESPQDRSFRQRRRRRR